MQNYSHITAGGAMSIKDSEKEIITASQNKNYLR